MEVQVFSQRMQYTRNSIIKSFGSLNTENIAIHTLLYKEKNNVIKKSLLWENMNQIMMPFKT